jgi:hypothetical protein
MFEAHNTGFIWPCANSAMQDCHLPKFTRDIYGSQLKGHYVKCAPREESGMLCFKPFLGCTSQADNTCRRRLLCHIATHRLEP